MATSVACNVSPSTVGLFSASSSLFKSAQTSSLKAAFPLRCCRSRSTLVNPRASLSQASNGSLKMEGLSKAFAGDNDDVAHNTFIDESMGVVCYETETGEIVCEGIDEGPHFYPPSVSNFYMPDTRAAAILPFFGEGMYEI